MAFLNLSQEKVWGFLVLFGSDPFCQNFFQNNLDQQVQMFLSEQN